MQMVKEKAGRITLADVAVEAGVSSATVSLALRNSPRILQETRQKVLKAAERVGYSTNLRVDDSRRIDVFQRKPQVKNLGFALAGADSTDRIYTVPFHAAAREAARKGQHLFCYPLLAEDSEGDTLMLLESSECGGFLLMGSVEDQHYNLLQKTGRPVLVLGDHRISRPVDLITFNDFQAGRASVCHLAGLGRRRIAFVSENLGFFHRQEWLRGYREEMKAQGLAINQGLVQTRMRSTPHLEVIKPIFERKPYPTAILATSHGEGLAVVNHCRELGLHVPRDVSVLILGNIRQDLYQEPLTCMESPIGEMGRLGMKRLCELIADPHEIPLATLLPISLRDHGSCAPPRAVRARNGRKSVL